MKKINKFKKILVRDDINIDKLIIRENRINPFKRIDFDKFLFKFRGSFIFRGKKSYSFKIYNFLLYKLKNNLKKNPIDIFIKIVQILMPFLILGKKKSKNRFVYVPRFAKGNNKNKLIINSLVKQFKGKSNKKGVDKEDILKIIIDTFNLKGSAINLKKDLYIETLKVRKNLNSNYKYYKMLNDWQLQKKKINKKEINRKKEEVTEEIIFLNNLKKYNIDPAINFYKRFSKYKKKKWN